MRRITLDYQRKPDSITLLGAVICTLTIGLLALLIFQSRQLGSEIAAFESRLHQPEYATGDSSGYDARSQDAYSQTDEVTQANQILHMLGLRWDSIFGALAKSHRNDIAVLSFAPDPDKRIVRIVAEAKNFQTMLDYLKRLEAQPALGAVYLQNHTTQKHDPQKPVRFTLIAEWLDR